MKKFALAILLTLSFRSFCAEIEIKMINKGSKGDNMVFEPAFVTAKVGDTVKFIPVDKGHSVQSFKDKESRPEGAGEIKSKLNETYTYKIENEGVHVFICKPHYAMGMIGMISAGKATNLEKIKSLKAQGTLAKKRFEALLTQIK